MTLEPMRTHRIPHNVIFSISTVFSNEFVIFVYEFFLFM